MENPTEIDITKKLKNLDKIKALEDGIISYINNTEYVNNKSVFLSMLINYVMPYNNYGQSITELKLNNNGIGFEKYIKNYLLELLNHYKEPRSSMTNTDISFSQLKLNLLTFFHTKISVIVPEHNEIHDIKTGARRKIPLKDIIDEKYSVRPLKDIIDEKDSVRPLKVKPSEANTPNINVLQGITELPNEEIISGISPSENSGAIQGENITVIKRLIYYP